MYAIIEDSGTQIKVSEGDVIKVALREMPADAASLTFDKVLLIGGEEGELKIGQPLVAGATVTADVLGQEKTDKVRIVKFVPKKWHMRKKGHRQDYLSVKVTSIKA